MEGAAMQSRTGTAFRAERGAQCEGPTVAMWLVCFEGPSDQNPGTEWGEEAGSTGRTGLQRLV